jgi:hypothetical protein
MEDSHDLHDAGLRAVGYDVTGAGDNEFTGPADPAELIAATTRRAAVGFRS